MSDEPQARNPIGWEFWAGKVVLVVASALIAVWLAVRAGSADAARFEQFSDIKAARNTLRVVRTELQGNLARLRATRATLSQKFPAEIELSLDSLRIALAKPYASLIDPALLAEIQRLFVWPLPEIEAMLRRGGQLGRQERDHIDSTCAKILERAQKVVLPMLDAQEKALDALETRLREHP